MLDSKVGLYLTLLVVVTLSSVSQASIENKPVKVTHQNSGPRYDIDEVEKTKLTPEREDAQPPTGRVPLYPMMRPLGPAAAEPQSEPREGADNEFPTIGRINVRRIFLIPLSRPSQDDNFPSSSIWSENLRSATQSKPANEGEVENNFGRNLWPFIAPGRHLFGADQASRSPPTADESFERPSMAEKFEASANREREDLEPGKRPLLDPIQLMMEMMQQALSQAINSPNGPLNDLNKELGSTKADSDNKAEPSETSGSTGSEESEVPKRAKTELDTAPAKQPISNNSTKEEIVEIDGKKYLKKTVVNRHVGENIVFMTKRLLFVPLNETAELPATEQANTNPQFTSVSANTEKQAETVTTPAEQVDPPRTTLAVNEDLPKRLEEATTVKVPISTTTTTTEQPSTTTTTTEQPSSTTTTTTTTTEQPSTTSTSTSTSTFSTTNGNAEETTPARKEMTIESIRKLVEGASDSVRLQDTPSN